MRANLHLHSCYSDGTLCPADIAQRAAEVGLEAAAVTDHDTLAGVVEFSTAAGALGLRSWPGVEIDCAAPEFGFKGELLAYFPDGRFGETERLLGQVRERRRRVAEDAIERADRHFVRAKLSFAELVRRKQGTRVNVDPEGFSFSKVDIYSYLRDAGAVPRDVAYKSFKRTYFDSGILSGDGGKNEKAHCSDVAAAVRADGGYLVLPHPGHGFGDDPAPMKKDDGGLGTLLDALVSIGLDGVELYYYRKADSEAINKLVRKLARPRGLMLTYGSDCHGPGSGKDTIGRFDGNFKGFRRRK